MTYKRQNFREQVGACHYYAESEQALTALASLRWEWKADPSRFGYVRIILGKPPSTPANKNVVAVGYDGGIRVAYAVVRGNDEEHGKTVYHPVTNPINKPCEAIDTRVLTEEITPAESVALTLARGGAA